MQGRSGYAPVSVARRNDVEGGQKKLVAWLGLTLTKETCCFQKHLISQELNFVQDLEKPIKLMNTQKSENSVDRQLRSKRIVLN